MLTPDAFWLALWAVLRLGALSVLLAFGLVLGWRWYRDSRRGE